MEGAGSQFKEIKVEKVGNSARIILHRPARGNAITMTMGEEIKRALTGVENDPQVGVIVLTGSGKHFCAGMDLGSANQQDMAHRLQTGSGASSAIQLFERLKQCKKPIIARINGAALGGGWGLIFTSDIRIAAKDSWFSFSEVKRGLVPAIISAYIVPQIGGFRAKEYMLTGRKISAQKAFELGFISRVVENEEQLDQATNECIDELLSSAPKAMAEIKSLVNTVDGHGHQTNLQEVEKVFQRMVQSEEAAYGIQCFAQRQKPDWIAFHNNTTSAKL